VRPIEIGRRLVRAIDHAKTTSGNEKTVAPNVFSVRLNEADRAAFGDLEKHLIAELVDAAKQYANDENYSLAGEVLVSIVTDAAMKRGKVEVEAAIVAGALAGSTSPPPASAPAVPPAPAVPVAPVAPTMATPSIPPIPAPSPAPAPASKKATLILGDGTRVALQPGVVSVGRSAESTLPLNDTNVSRKHAELRSRGEGTALSWVLVDLGSTNGTMLNGVKISGEQKLKNGDSLMFGNTSARFEVA
jgi:hypothetical protein